MNFHTKCSINPTQRHQHQHNNNHNHNPKLISGVVICWTSLLDSCKGLTEISLKELSNLKDMPHFFLKILKAFEN